MQSLGQRAAGSVLVVWGLGMLYATWRPDSLLGCIFVGPFAAAGRLASVSWYLSGALGFVMAGAGVAILVIG